MACFSWQVFDRPQNNGTNNFIPFSYKEELGLIKILWCDAESENEDHVLLKRVDEG